MRKPSTFGAVGISALVTMSTLGAIFFALAVSPTARADPLVAKISPATQTAFYHYTGCILPTAYFAGSATGGTPPYVQYNWAFGDGSGGQGPNVQHTYPPTYATYTVHLTVVDSAGNWDSADPATVDVRETQFC